MAIAGLPGHAEGGKGGLSGTLLYSRLTNGTWQVWRKEFSTQQAEQLTFSAVDKRYPTRTPDGRIVFHTSNQASYIVEPGTSESAPLLETLWPMRDLVWSPDGARMAFSKIRTDLVDSANLWVADAKDRERVMLTQESGMQYQPAWSPDGRQLAYIGGHGYGTYEVYLINANGTDRRQLTTNHTHEFLPAWSPDGAAIAYSADATGDYEIWVISADGTGARQLTHAPGLDTRPAWSPDGRWIAFATNRTGTLEIWVMAADGSGQRPLIQAEGGACDPAWR